MSHLTRKLLAAVAACALTSACLPNISGDQSYSGQDAQHRWKVTDESGKVLSAGCAKESDASSNSEYWAMRIKIHAAAGSHIIDEDNLGQGYVDKWAGHPLPTSDAYWCSDQDTQEHDPSWNVGLDTLHVVDVDPPATIDSVELIKPHNDSRFGVIAEGFRAHLHVRHPGVLHLGYTIGTNSTDAGSDAGDGGMDAGQVTLVVYPAMTIE